MKKLILIFATVFCTQAAFAQFDFGIKAGLNLNKIHTDAGSLNANYKESLDTKTGFSAGIFARIGDKIFLQPEVLYTERNGNIIELNGNTIHKIKYKSVDVPVLVGFKLFDFLRVNAGPVANIKLKEEGTFFNTVGTATKDDAIKNATFGYQAGAGLSFGPIDIDVRKDGSLGSISSKHFQDQKFNQKLDGWQVSLGLRF
jgi:opacity protein-like surface antigen